MQSIWVCCKQNQNGEVAPLLIWRGDIQFYFKEHKINTIYLYQFHTSQNVSINI